MLKTNSKKAMGNIKQYIKNHESLNEYGINTEEMSFEEIAANILDNFRKEKMISHAKKQPEQMIFCDWSCGLPSILDTCYHYNRSAVDDLAAILEETEEASKYTEEQAESLLDYLIYRELIKAEKKHSK